MFSVMNLLSGALLLYTAITVPVQICLWKYDDPCNAFPTLYFDVTVDSFFLVICQILHSELIRILHFCTVVSLLALMCNALREGT
jgi:hypothetical protein